MAVRLFNKETWGAGVCSVSELRATIHSCYGHVTGLTGLHRFLARVLALQPSPTARSLSPPLSPLPPERNRRSVAVLLGHLFQLL
jgi:hypothetical protein